MRSRNKFEPRSENDAALIEFAKGIISYMGFGAECGDEEIRACCSKDTVVEKRLYTKNGNYWDYILGIKIDIDETGFVRKVGYGSIVKSFCNHCGNIFTTKQLENLPQERPADWEEQLEESGFYDDEDEEYDEDEDEDYEDDEQPDPEYDLEADGHGGVNNTDDDGINVIETAQVMGYRITNVDGVTKDPPFG